MEERLPKRGRPRNPEKANETTLHISLPKPLKERLMADAVENGRTLKATVTRIIKAACEGRAGS